MKYTLQNKDFSLKLHPYSSNTQILTMQTQQSWKVGLALSLLVVGFWATLPVALKVSLSAVDAWTLTWFRFCTATIFTLAVIFYTGSWRGFIQLKLKDWLWLILAGLMLIGNYVFYLLGLEKTTPGNAQVLIQLAPFLMIVGGVYFFKENFYFEQKVGASLLVLGLILFFKDQLDTVLLVEYKAGVALMVFAAISWAIYALIQKKLHAVLSSQAILAVIYLLASVLLLPFSTPDNLTGLNQQQWIAVAYACFNTVGAYGAFSLALTYWQASRVGMVIAIVPVFSLFFINFMARLLPELVAFEHITSIGFIGVVLIVSGSMFANISLANKPRP